MAEGQSEKSARTAWAALLLLRSLLPVMGGLAAALAMHFFIAPAVGPYYARMLNDIGIAIVLAVSLNIVNGFTGQFSLGHAGFMAVGAYVGGVVTYYGAIRMWGTAAIPVGSLSALHAGFTDWPWVGRAELLFFGACVLSGLAAAAVGYIVGLPSLRLRGDYLAIVTLGFVEIVHKLLEQTGATLNDPAEIRATPWWKLFNHVGGGLGFSTLYFYTTPFWVYAWVAAVLIVALRLKYSTYGRAFLAVRENEIAAAALGVSVTRIKVLAFVMSAFFAGVAGCLLPHLSGTIKPQELGFMRSFEVVIIVVLGGSGSISGSVLAAIILTVLFYFLRELPSAQQYRMIVYSLSLVVMMIVRPQGLLGLRELWDLKFFRRLLRRDRLAGEGA